MKFQAFVLASILCAPVYAQSPETEQDACAGLGEVSETLFAIRAEGYPLSEVLAEINDPVARALVIAVYAEPMFQTPAMQQRQRRDFRNELELACYSGTGRLLPILLAGPSESVQ